MEITKKELGRRLRAARKNVRLTQERAASALTLPRVAITQIEAGNRPVSSIELFQLARLYRRDVSELLSESPLQEDPFTSLHFEEWQDQPELYSEIESVLSLLREAVNLESYLGDSLSALPPTYRFSDPLSVQKAVEQGKELAILERKRLDVGSAPLLDIAGLISAQDIWTASVSLPDFISGFCLKIKQENLAILVNQSLRAARMRAAYAHEYAHALLDRDRRLTPTCAKNASDLFEKRANAFATEFLLPENGVIESLERIKKYGISRADAWLYDVANDRTVLQEKRSDSGMSPVNVQDVALLAHEYRVTYEMVVYQLPAVGAVKKRELQSLLEKQKEGQKLAANLHLFDPEELPEENGLLCLQRRLALLAIEAYRREKITSGRFREICRMARLPAEELFEIAQSSFK